MANVIWNQFAPELNSDNYAPYNPSNTSVSFDEGVGTMTWLVDGGGGASYSIRPNDYWMWEVGHISYFSYEINPSFDGGQWSVEFGGGYIPTGVICPANTWTRLSFIGKNPQSSAGNKRFYIPNRRFGGTVPKTGDTCKFRNPVFINLTTMFGAGNEPLDVKYFEYLCAINGVDVTKAQPYEPNGVSKNWLLGKVDQSLFSARRRILINTPHIETASGTVATFKTDIAGKIKECKINFLPVQSGSGEPSLTNIRPFSGWTGLDVKRTGKNLYDISSYPLTSGIWIHGGSGYTAEGATYAATLDYIPFEGYDGQTITLNRRPGGANPGIAFYDFRKWYISGVANAGGTAGAQVRAIVPAGTKYIRFTVPANATDIQLEIGTEATAYEPYKGDVFTKTWSSTVYGGYLNLVKGELVATEKVITLTGTESGAGIGWESYTFVDKDLEVPNNSRYVRGCSHTKNAIHGGGMHQSTTSAGGGYDIAAAVSTGQYCRFRNRLDCTTLTDYQTWLQGQYSAGTPVQIWAKIIPVTYQLSPQQIKSLRGMNNISSNANSSIEVTFWTH